MSMFKLIAVIVPHNKADRISSSAVNAGSAGGTVLMGRGLTGSKFLSVLGLGESLKDILLFLCDKEKTNQISAEIKKTCANERKNFGRIFILDSQVMIKAGNIFSEEKDEGGDSMDHTYQLISVILNKGYADDAMAAARKAGAGGGTVLNARGTAREDDEKFFGMHIVPEKEMLMMVVPSEKKDNVLKAIKELPCLQQPGSGIAFCSGVDSFDILGKK